MPKRSNDFQNLMARIQEAISGPNSKVEESAMVYNRFSEKEEEIDILLTFDGHGHDKVRFGIQCRDHSRPSSPDWIKSLKTQRDGCGLDRMIAVHSKGFTEAAYREADAHSIDAWTVSQASDVKWSKVLVQRMRFERRPYIKSVELFPAPMEIDGQPVVSTGVLHLVKTGEEYGTPIEFAARQIVRMTTAGSKQLQKDINAAKDADQDVIYQDHGPFELKYAGRSYPVKVVRLTITWIRELPVTWRFIRINEKDRIVPEGIAQDEDGEIRMVVPDGEDSDKLVISFREHGGPQPRKFDPNRSKVTPGRNDPCNCGSGKKFKRCCMNKPKSNSGLVIDMFKNTSVTFNKKRRPPASP